MKKEHKKKNPADEHCRYCDEIKFNHPKNDSQRRCKKCNSITFGHCHGGGLKTTENGADYTCHVCRGDPVASDVAKAELAQAKTVTEDTVLPEKYGAPDWTLGDPTESDNAAALDEKAKLPAIDDKATSATIFLSSLGNSPSAALIPGETFGKLKFQLPSKQIAKTQHPTTTSNHLRHLRQLQNHINNTPSWKRIPLTRAAVRYLLLQAKLNNWREVTLHRTACALHGALSSLPLYSDAKVPVKLGEDPFWQRMMKFWRMYSNQNQPHSQPTLMRTQILEALAAIPLDQLETKAMLVLQWCLAARVSDVIPLRRENIVYKKDTRSLTVTIDAGKTMAKVQPYTVHTEVAKEFAPILEEFLELDWKPKQHLFPFNVIPRSTRIARVNAALKSAQDDLTTRSVRRGAITAMAVAGVPIKDIMAYSGHRSEDTCKRYMSWGRHFTFQKAASAKAATFLTPLPAPRTHTSTSSN
jgi:integrase